MKFFALLSLCCAAAFGETTNYSSCFVPGEVSEYKVSWMKLPLAWSRTETDSITLDDKKLIRIRMISKTYKAYKHIYNVDDVTEVILDPVTALPVQLDIVLNEGGRRKSQVTRFDHANLTATYIDRVAHTTNTVTIAKDTQEVLSFLYASRGKNLTSMQEKIHTIYVDGKINEMGVSLGKQKRIKVPNVGKVECVRLEPVAEFDGLFLRQGKIFFWVSKENRRMVTLVEAKVPVGKIAVQLQKVAGPGNDFWVRRKEEK